MSDCEDVGRLILTRQDRVKLSNSVYFHYSELCLFCHLQKESGRTLCLPYCMETNDFSLVLTKQFDARQYAQTIEDHVRQLAKEDGEKVVCLGTSDSVNF